jgi:hypothetical protein
MVDEGDARKVQRLRRVCAGCPVAGECLRDASELPGLLRHMGPVRVGVTGFEAWRPVERVVAELGPRTLEDWRVVAAWVVDGDLRRLAS